MKVSHGVNYISQYSNHSSEKHCASPPNPNVRTRSCMVQKPGTR
ncbi:hypothetical protein JOE51_000741 [Bradyrhizobium japonicum]|nr:hypothetical protein [Bradyrhizobium japonicum]